MPPTADVTTATALPSPPPAGDAATNPSPPPQPQVTRKRLAGAYGQCGASASRKHSHYASAAPAGLTRLVDTGMTLIPAYWPLSCLAHLCATGTSVLSAAPVTSAPSDFCFFQLTAAAQLQEACGAILYRPRTPSGATRCARWAQPAFAKAQMFGAAILLLSPFPPCSLPVVCPTC